MSPMPSATASSNQGERGDVLIVGGGITGCGIALDLALRGVRVTLLERDDFACATSSASSRLIHGGLRYLEQFQFGFVREALVERARLLDLAPDHVRPEPFVFALRDDDRLPLWKLAAGLTLYGALSLPKPIEWPRLAAKREIAAVFGSGSAAPPRGIRGGGFYTDGATHDAKLTLAIAAAARSAGATMMRRFEVTRIEPLGDRARVTARDRFDGRLVTLVPRVVVCAAGPFTDALRRATGTPSKLLAVTRGTHVVVPAARLPLARSVIFTSGVDGRVVFLLRWGRFTAIGTTDVDADPESPVVATRDEVEYLIRSANALLPDLRLTIDDALSAVAGLRPLLKQGDRSASARSREEIVLQDGPVFTIGGGKLTGYRSIAEKVGARVARFLGKSDAHDESPTRSFRLPASDPRFAALEQSLSADDVAATRNLVTSLRHDDPRLSPADLLLRRTDLGLDAPVIVAGAAERLENAMCDLPAAILEDSRAQIAARQAFRR
jgi:glycerol-3-phosphate dehydrogenase